MESESKKDTKTETKSVSEEMEASKYVGQGFQPPAEKDAIEFAKKHKDKIAKRGEQFFMDNFGLKVKATNVVGSGDGVEVFVHCDDHDIVFNASIPFDKSIIDSDSSIKSEDKGDDMSTLVGTVLSGFEYRAQKEKYDNLYKFFKDNEEKYQYTGFTKEAINKTQNSGYENEYFYITTIPYNLTEYRDYFEPLLNRSNSEFSKEMSNVKKQLKDKSKVSLTTTLFSKKKNYTKKNNSENVIEMAEEIKKEKDIPNEIDLSIQFSDNRINTIKPNYSSKDNLEYGVFDNE
ncbi:lipoprotein [Staphylococcus aureus]|nr:lipoprotein [Staphylococcus aureus]CAC6934178.1 lipoprotein [Staphylococcus aureus]